MATNPVAGAVGSMLGSAAGAVSAPWAMATSAITNLGAKLIDLIPDPNKKLEAQQHVTDQQFQLALAQIDQQNKMMAAASQNISADSKVSGARAYLCYGVTTMILYNYMMTPLLRVWFKWDVHPVDLPTNILVIFAVIMLGFVGIPQSIDMVKTIASMPGDSQVRLPLGLGSIGNKS